jgi:hypothetical protein
MPIIFNRNRLTVSCNYYTSAAGPGQRFSVINYFESPSQERTDKREELKAFDVPGGVAKS